MIKKVIAFSVAMVALFALEAFGGKKFNMIINGAGASFPFPVYSEWAYEYNSLTGVKLNYQSIGSGGGIAQIKAKTVAFGASDAPLKPDELGECGLIQFPMIMGGIVPVINVEGIKAGELRLTADVLADIFLGKITKWDDSRIKEVNEEINIPRKDITVVHRADGSGTTWLFTNYLDKVSKEWHEKVGTGKAVDWPAGVGGKGNEGVASYVQRVSGAIGYVEFAYALKNNLTYTLMQNKEGKFIAPTIHTFKAAAANAEWEDAPGYYLVLTDQPGKDSWPITGASFILMHKDQDSEQLARETLKFFDWCYKHGKESAEKLHYVLMPDNVVEMVERTWEKKIRAGGKKVWP
jgi:phosphate transport system substrate-binding protein